MNKATAQYKNKEVNSKTTKNFMGSIWSSIAGVTQKTPLKEYPQDLSDYKNRVHQKRLNQDGTPEPNGSPDHSTIQISELVQGSQSLFQIYDKDISGDLLERTTYVNILDDISSFIQRNENNKVEIVVDPETRTNEKWLTKLKNIDGDRIKIYQIRANVKNITEKTPLDKLPYFAVNDSSSYRQEDKTDKDDREAFCSFNNPSKSKQFKTIFEQLKAVSRPI